ncbi:hypothetical protein [Enterobacter phage vB_EcRAM-01]|nr:hypothetical protein [Enterobacter phage vB_EcRAM-01]
MELFAGKTYGLTVSPEVFAEKTWKTSLAAIIRKQGYVLIDRTSIGEFEDKAFVLDGEYEYEIPASEWKWFKEVTPEDGEFTPEEAEEVNRGEGIETENGMRIATPEEVSAGAADSDPRLMDIPQFMYRSVQQNPMRDLKIDPSFGANLETLSIAPMSVRKSDMMLRFALQHLFSGGSIYQINMESDLKMQEDQIANLFDLHTQLTAVENIEKLLGKEKKRILQDLKPYGKKNESRNLRDSRKSS